MQQARTSNLNCPMCKHPSYSSSVKVIYKGRVENTFESALRAEDWAIDNHCIPCRVRYVSTCLRCNYENVKIERPFIL